MNNVLLRGVLFLERKLGMNILLIGEQEEHLKKFQALLELAFPENNIASCSIEDSKQALQSESYHWNIVLFLLIHPSLHQVEVLKICEERSFSVMYIVKRNESNNYMAMIEKGVKGIIGYDAPLDLLRNGLRYVKEGGVFFDPKIAKEMDLSSALKKNLFLENSKTGSAAALIDDEIEL